MEALIWILTSGHDQPRPPFKNQIGNPLCDVFFNDLRRIFWVCEVKLSDRWYLGGCNTPITIVASPIAITPSRLLIPSPPYCYHSLLAPMRRQSSTKGGEMCHLTECDTFKLEPIIEVSLVPFLLDTKGRAGCVCVYPHIYHILRTKIRLAKWGHVCKVGPSCWAPQLQRASRGLRL